MARVIRALPPPHDLSHCPRFCHALTWQSTGQACDRHFRVSARLAHARPPWAAARFMALRRTLKPPPHDWLHAPHAPYSDRTQSTGHSASVVHAATSTRAGQRLPPNAGSRATALSLLFVLAGLPGPPSQDLVQPPKPPQASTAQSIGQGCVLQSRSSESGPHGAPPFCAAMTTLRVRQLYPDPQDCEHALHGRKAESAHATSTPGRAGLGHACVLQARNDFRVGHASPPNRLTRAMLRRRICVPAMSPLSLAHVAEHASHLPQSVTAQPTGHA
jgi:hypothetical protein